MPLGHGAHALSKNKSVFAAGMAGTLVAEGGIERRVSSLVAAAQRLESWSVGPGVSPWVSARTGLGNGFEGGVGASARSIRLDGRKSFERGSAALSIGLGVSAIMAERPGDEPNNSGVFGGGFDVPVLLGWHSSADLYALWIGPRLGGELVGGGIAADGEGVEVSGRHLWFGGVAGVRVGLRHLYAVFELDVAHHLADGFVGEDAFEVEAFTFAPAAALAVSF